MKSEIITEDYPNGQRKFETPYVNGVPHGFVSGWYDNGQKSYEAPYVNGQANGLAKWWYRDGSLEYLSKWYKDQLVLGIRFPYQEQIPGDAEIELFFHPTPELS